MCGHFFMIDTDNGFHLEFVKGNFDDYCVQVSKNGYNYRWFRDDEYFRWIRKLAEKYGVEQVYKDFVFVYDNVWVGVDSEYANKIVRMVEKLDVTFYESFAYDGEIPSVVLSKEIFGVVLE